MVSFYDLYFENYFSVVLMDKGNKVINREQINIIPSSLVFLAWIAR